MEAEIIKLTKGYKPYITVSQRKNIFQIWLKKTVDHIYFQFLYNEKIVGKSEFNIRSGELKSSKDKIYNSISLINSPKLIGENVMGILIIYTCYGMDFGCEHFPFGNGVYYMEICANDTCMA